MATSEWKTDGIGHTSDERETTDILIDLTMKPMHESKSIGATTPEETHHHFPQCLRCLLYTSPSPRDHAGSRIPSSA